MEFDVQRCSRTCAATGRELNPGETVFSVLVRDGANLVRQDYSAEAWSDVPEDAVAWWKLQIPRPEAKKTTTWAPNDVMLELFEQLVDQPEKEDMRYVLALLLVRRRVLRLEDTTKDDLNREAQVFHCSRRDCDYVVPVVLPDEAKAREIQDELQSLLSVDPGGSQAG